MPRLIPFEYAIRNLGRSPLRLFMSLFGSVLVVGVVVTAGAFVQGMERSLVSSGAEKNVIFLGAGSEESIERSEMSPSVTAQVRAGIRGIREEGGVSFLSPEVHMALMVAFAKEDPSLSQAVFRGVTPAAFSVHPAVQISEGRFFNPGADEIIVGNLTATRLNVPQERMAIGQSLWVEGRELTIVGRFNAPGTVMDAEVWCSLAGLQLLSRRDSLSCIVLSLGEGEFADAEAFAAMRLDLEIVALRESDYYRKLVAFYQPVRIMIWVTALLVGLGGLLGGLNTMVAAFSSRAPEIGMLQSLGYSRLAVMLSFVQESVLVSASGALVGTGFCLLFLDGTAIRFTMGVFALMVDGSAVTLGLGAGLLLGVVGSLPPTLRCLRMSITEALKSS